MKKVHRDNIHDNEEFQFATAFIQGNIAKIAKTYQTEDDLSTDEKANRHYMMVCSITNFLLKCVSALSEDLLQSINKSQGNLIILNKFLAVRQLADTQLNGILQGTWGIPPDITNSEDFQKHISESTSIISVEQIITDIKQS